MTTHICDLSPSSEDPESARALLYRHGLPEDVIDGVLCLHAQELAAVQRKAHDEQRPYFHMGLPCKPEYDCGVRSVIDLIDPTRTEAAVPAAVEPPAERAALHGRRERYAVALYNTLETSPFHTPWEELGPLRRTVWYARAEAAMAVADAEHAVVEPPADRAALRDRIAEAVEQLHQTGAVYALGAGEAGRIADAVLAVLSEAADRAAVLREEADRIDATRADFPIAVQNGITWATAELRRHATECPQCGTTGACNGGPCPLRRMADETATTGTQPETCAHCGQPISRITGTLTAWWVHDPGGNTICHPEQAASSTRATPKPAAEAECTCAHAGASFAPAGHYADCPAAGARQDGAQS